MTDKAILHRNWEIMITIVTKNSNNLPSIDQDVLWKTPNWILGPLERESDATRHHLNTALRQTKAWQDIM